MKRDPYEAYLSRRLKEAKAKEAYYRKRNLADKTPLDYCDSDWSSWFEWQGTVDAYKDALHTYLAHINGNPISKSKT